MECNNKRLTFSEPFTSHRRKVLSGFTLGLVASLLFLSLLFLNSSSFSSWHFPSSSNVSITSLHTIHEEQQFSKTPQVNVSNQGFENTLLGNFTQNRYNASFQSNGVGKVGNFFVGKSEIGGNLSGSVVVEENVKDGKFVDEKCDIFDGNWMRDDSKPYYDLGSCPFVDRDFDCHLNGRPDSDYVKWKWKPNGCDIPRYVYA